MRPSSWMATIILSASVCLGQPLSIGVTGGGRATDDVIGATAESRRYVVGPMVELGLPWSFGVESDALYHRSGYLTGYGNFADFSHRKRARKLLGVPDSAQVQARGAQSQTFHRGGTGAAHHLRNDLGIRRFSIDIMTGQRTPFSSVERTDWSSQFWNRDGRRRPVRAGPPAASRPRFATRTGPARQSMGPSATGRRITALRNRWTC